jgi:TetR/AcrR family transcriptional regulator, ethionamide resistance regulator
MASVTRKAQNGRTARRAQIGRELRVAVEKLLAAGESFTEVSVERLVSEAGVSRSTFYVYFEDKGELLRAWFADVEAEVEEAAKDWWALDADASREDLHRALTKIVESYRPHTTLMAAMYDAAAYDPAVRELVQTMMDWNIAGLRAHIKAGQKAGFVDPELLPQQTAAWLQWMAERGFHQLVRTAGKAERERLIDAYTSIVWNTLYAPVR